MAFARTLCFCFLTLIGTAAAQTSAKESVIVVESCKEKLVIAADAKRPSDGTCNIVELADGWVMIGSGVIKATNPEDPNYTLDAYALAKTAYSKLKDWRTFIRESANPRTHMVAYEWRRAFLPILFHAARGHLLKENPEGLETRVVFATTDGTNYSAFEMRISCNNTATNEEDCETHVAELATPNAQCTFTRYGIDDITKRALDPKSNESRHFWEWISQDREAAESHFPIHLVELTQDFTADTSKVSPGPATWVELRGGQKPQWSSNSCK